MTRYAFKITLIGDGGVGKTSLRRRFMGKKFVANHLSTIGADFSSQKVFLDDGDEVEFQVWDLAGQVNFKSVRVRFYGGTKGSLCVFDLTSKESFHNLPKWIDELFTNSGSGPVPVMMVGNKVDLDNQRIVEASQVDQYIQALEQKLGQQIHYFETSAKTGENVRQAFQRFAIQMRNQAISE